MFTYNHHAEEFYYLEADYIHSNSTDKRPLFLYTVDAATGKATKKVS